MKAILIDLDGVVFEHRELVPGAKQLIQLLQARNFPHLFLTNISSLPRSAIVNRFKENDVDIKPQEILTPAVACAQWLCEHGIDRLSLLLPRDTAEDLVGFEILPLNGESHPEAIVVGDLGHQWSFAKLNLAFRALMETPQPRLVALGLTRYYRAQDGLNLDVAPFIKALEFASGCEAEIIGKPSATFFEEALHILNVQASECAMIGDDIVSDVKGAQDAGLQGILCRTGKFRASDLNSDIQPDGLLDSVADLQKLLNL